MPQTLELSVGMVVEPVLAREMISSPRRGRMSRVKASLEEWCLNWVPGMRKSCLGNQGGDEYSKWKEQIGMKARSYQKWAEDSGQFKELTQTGEWRELRDPEREGSWWGIPIGHNLWGGSSSCSICSRHHLACSSDQKENKSLWQNFSTSRCHFQHLLTGLF